MDNENEQKEKTGRTFNFVTSIKGGCGKTTFSVFLARYLEDACKESEKSTEKEEHCLIFDMDFQGTSMENLFWGIPKDMPKAHKYLNAAIRESREIDDFIVKNLISEDVVLDTIFADSDVKEKEKFRISSRTGYSPAVQYNVFKGGLIRFLNKFMAKKTYKHFIFDMPPNSDGYSSAAMECVMDSALEKKGEMLNYYKIKKKQDVINLFYLTSFDAGQILQTINHIVDDLKNRDFYFDNLFLVLNNNIIGSHNLGNEPLSNIANVVENFKKTLNSLGLQQTEYERIFILCMYTIEKYAVYGTTGIGLNRLKDHIRLPLPHITVPFEDNEETSETISSYIPTSPVTKVATFDDNYNFKDYTNLNDPKWLLKKMLQQKPEEKK